MPRPQPSRVRAVPTIFDVTDATTNGGFAGLTNLTVSGGEGIGVDADNAVLIMSGVTVARTPPALDRGAGVHNDGQLWATNVYLHRQQRSSTEGGGAVQRRRLGPPER